MTGQGASANTGYAALLRGINVGGNKQVRMEDLRKAFESMGFEDVTTILNSGNVLFRATAAGDTKLEGRIRGGLEEAFGIKADVMVRTGEEIRRLVASDPFKKVKTTPQTRLYVTFLPGEPKSKLKIPYESPEGDIRILGVASGAVFTTIELSPKKGTVDLMKIVESEFGRNVTTRNWNTVLKIEKKLAGMDGAG